MKLIKNKNTKIVKPCLTCTIHEYAIADDDINIALAHIQGRYPTTGYSLNLQSKIMAFVIAGSGKIMLNKATINLSQGDTILIEPGEYYAWNGTMTLLLPATPAWIPEQYRHVKYVPKRKRA